MNERIVIKYGNDLWFAWNKMSCGQERKSYGYDVLCALSEEKTKSRLDLQADNCNA